METAKVTQKLNLTCACAMLSARELSSGGKSASLPQASADTAWQEEL